MSNRNQAQHEMAPGPRQNSRGDFLAKSAIYTLAFLTSMGAIASAAQAKIVPGKSVAGVELGDTGGMVKNKLGKPFATSQYQGTKILRYDRPFLGTISIDNGQVDGMTTYSKTQKTSAGVGPGTSYDATTSAYPDATCSVGTFGPNSSTCVVDSELNGQAVTTDFVFFDTSLPMREVDIGYN